MSGVTAARGPLVQTVFLALASAPASIPQTRPGTWKRGLLESPPPRHPAFQRGSDAASEFCPKSRSLLYTLDPGLVFFTFSPSLLTQKKGKKKVWPRVGARSKNPLRRLGARSKAVQRSPHLRTAAGFQSAPLQGRAAGLPVFPLSPLVPCLPNSGRATNCFAPPKQKKKSQYYADIVTDSA